MYLQTDEKIVHRIQKQKFSLLGYFVLILIMVLCSVGYICSSIMSHSVHSTRPMISGPDCLALFAFVALFYTGIKQFFVDVSLYESYLVIRKGLSRDRYYIPLENIYCFSAYESTFRGYSASITMYLKDGSIIDTGLINAVKPSFCTMKSLLNIKYVSHEVIRKYVSEQKKHIHGEQLYIKKDGNIIVSLLLTFPIITLAWFLYTTLRG